MIIKIDTSDLMLRETYISGGWTKEEIADIRKEDAYINEGLTHKYIKKKIAERDYEILDDK